MVSVLGFDPIRVRAMCVEESQFGFAKSDRTKRRLMSLYYNIEISGILASVSDSVGTCHPYLYN